MTSLVIGRYQPVHDGHIGIVKTLLEEGKNVVIGLRVGPVTSQDPYTMEEREKMFREVFGDRVSFLYIPEDGSLEVVRGRETGWDLRTISLQPELERISATAIRASKPKTPGRTLWFMGLPSAGKTTLASKVAREAVGYILLDGDDVRKSVVNYDMSDAGRMMHLSYMAHSCKLLNDCGVNVAAAFVTPMQAYRDRIKELLPDVHFIWARCSRENCALRDPKGLWKKSTDGKLKGLTGADGSWEDPKDVTLTIQTDGLSIDESFAAISKTFGLIRKTA